MKKKSWNPEVLLVILANVLWHSVQGANMFINQSEKQFVILHPTKNPKQKNWEGLDMSEIKASCSCFEPDVIIRKQFSQRLNWSFEHQTSQLKETKRFFPRHSSPWNKHQTINSDALKKALFCLVERHMAIQGQRAPKFMSNFPITLYNTSPTVSSALWL